MSGIWTWESFSRLSDGHQISVFKTLVPADQYTVWPGRHEPLLAWAKINIPDRLGANDELLSPPAAAAPAAAPAPPRAHRQQQSSGAPVAAHHPRHGPVSAHAGGSDVSSSRGNVSQGGHSSAHAQTAPSQYQWTFLRSSDGIANFVRPLNLLTARDHGRRVQIVLDAASQAERTRGDIQARIAPYDAWFVERDRAHGKLTHYRNEAVPVLERIDNEEHLNDKLTEGYEMLPPLQLAKLLDKIAPLVDNLARDRENQVRLETQRYNTRDSRRAHLPALEAVQGTRVHTISLEESQARAFRSDAQVLRDASQGLRTALKCLRDFAAEVPTDTINQYNYMLELENAVEVGPTLARDSAATWHQNESQGLINRVIQVAVDQFYQGLYREQMGQHRQ